MTSAIKFKNSPLGITANKLNKALLQSGGGGGSGDMSKAVYDADGNGIVDTADSIPWARVTGKPTALGDMTKAVYDTNNDGISDHAVLADTATSAAAVPWAGITGKPAVFPPDSSAMLKSVYDTNADDIVDHAALADTAPWSGISGKPALPDPGTWAALSYATGWSQFASANYRIQVIGTIKTVFAQGIIAYASGAASLAFTLPAAARPAVARGCSLAGYDSTGDVLLFQATIGTDGTVKLMPLVRQGFVWPSATNGNVYLDSLSFSL